MIFVLDASHGGTKEAKRGFYGTTYEANEGVNNYLTALELKKELERYNNVTVELTRHHVLDNPWPGRGLMYPGAHVYLAIDSNSYDGVVTGTEVFHGYGSHLAAKLSKAVSDFLDINDRGTKDGDHWQVISESRKTTKYQLLIETGFHDHPETAKKLLTKRAALARVIAMTFADYFALELKPLPIEVATAPEGQLFRVAVGAYKERDNAIKTMNQLGALGIESYLALVPDPDYKAI